MYKAVLLIILMLSGSTAASQGVGDIEAAINSKRFGDANASRSVVDTKSAIGCPTGTAGEVVVCGSANREFGPDSDVMKAAEPALPPAAEDRRVTANRVPCGTGGNLCDSGQIPVTAMALAGAKALIQAIKGEDWQEVFRTRPDEYQRYLDTKNQRQTRARFSVDVRAGTAQ